MDDEWDFSSGGGGWDLGGATLGSSDASSYYDNSWSSPSTSYDASPSSDQWWNNFGGTTTPASTGSSNNWDLGGATLGNTSSWTGSNSFSNLDTSGYDANFGQGNSSFGNYGGDVTSDRDWWGDGKSSNNNSDSYWNTNDNSSSNNDWNFSNSNPSSFDANFGQGNNSFGGFGGDTKSTDGGWNSDMWGDSKTNDWSGNNSFSSSNPSQWGSDNWKSDFGSQGASTSGSDGSKDWWNNQDTSSKSDSSDFTQNVNNKLESNTADTTKNNTDLDVETTGNVPKPGDKTDNDRILDRISQIESGGKANAKAKTSSASGTFQFTNGTWMATVKQANPEWAQGMSKQQILDARFDPDKSREMAGVLTQSNADYLQKKGIEATPGALYSAHFLGQGGAAKVYGADPSTPIGQVVNRDQLAANPGVFVKNNIQTAGDFQNWAEGKMGMQGATWNGNSGVQYAGGGPTTTASIPNTPASLGITAGNGYDSGLNTQAWDKQIAQWEANPQSQFADRSYGNSGNMGDSNAYRNSVPGGGQMASNRDPQYTGSNNQSFGANNQLGNMQQGNPMQQMAQMMQQRGGQQAVNPIQAIMQMAMGGGQQSVSPYQQQMQQYSPYNGVATPQQMQMAQQYQAMQYNNNPVANLYAQAFGGMGAQQNNPYQQIQQQQYSPQVMQQLAQAYGTVGGNQQPSAAQAAGISGYPNLVRQMNGGGGITRAPVTQGAVYGAGTGMPYNRFPMGGMPNNYMNNRMNPQIAMLLQNLSQGRPQQGGGNILSLLGQILGV